MQLLSWFRRSTPPMTRVVCMDMPDEDIEMFKEIYNILQKERQKSTGNIPLARKYYIWYHRLLDEIDER